MDSGVYSFVDFGKVTNFNAQNATIRDNICFGRPFVEEKYWEVIKQSCLEADLDILPNGDLTEVGEKGEKTWDFEDDAG